MTGAHSRTEIIDYELEDWNVATRRATTNELVVTWVFDKALEMIPSRVCGWLAEGVIDEPRVPVYTWSQRVCAIVGVIHYVDAVHYDVQEWAWATRIATSNGRLRKDIFDAALKSYMDPVIDGCNASFVGLFIDRLSDIVFIASIGALHLQTRTLLRSDVDGETMKALLDGLEGNSVRRKLSHNRPLLFYPSSQLREMTGKDIFSQLHCF